MKTVLQLIKEKCANHDNSMNDVKNHCCSRSDYTCICFSEEDSRCAYFETLVLPLEPELEAVYWAKLEAQINNYELTSQEVKEIKKQNKPEDKKKRARVSSKMKKRFG